MATQYFIEANPVWAFLGLDGLPAAGGFIYTYESSNHAIPKATYQNVEGTTPWSNPITLDSTGKQSYLGTCFPIFWADDAPYYIVITDVNNNVIFAGDGFPWSGNVTPVVTETDIENYILNSQFYFDYAATLNNAGDRGFNNLPSGDVLIAPGPWYFTKNNTSATDEILVISFDPGAAAVPNNPNAYLFYSCTVPGTGETTKRFSYRFRSVRQFAGETINFQLQAKTTLSNQVNISYTQYFGAGGSTTFDHAVATQTLTTNFINYEFTIEVDNILGDVIGPNGDDYFQINIDLPLNSVAGVGFTNAALRYGAVIVPFQEESVVITAQEAIVEQFPLITDLGINVNDGCYMPYLLKGNTQFSYRSWAGLRLSMAMAYSMGFTEFLYEDGSLIFSQNYYNLANRILTNWGVGTDSFYSTTTNGVTLTVSATGVVTGASIDVNSHYLVYGDIVGAVSVNAQTIVYALTGAQTTNNSYFFISNTTTDFYVWFNLNGTGTDPMVAGRTGVMIPYTGAETSAQMAALIAAASIAGITSNIPTTTLTAISTTVGAVSAINAGTSGLTVNQTIAGSGSVQAQSTIQLVAGSAIINGSYLLINTPGQEYYLWFCLNNKTEDPGYLPALSGKVGIKVVYVGSETIAQMVALVALQLTIAQVRLPYTNGLFARAQNNGSGRDPDALSRVAILPGGATGDNVGSYQEDELGTHIHGTTAANGGGAGPYFNGVALTGPNPGANTEATGGNETRPSNYYVDNVILY